MHKRFVLHVQQVFSLYAVHSSLCTEGFLFTCDRFQTHRKFLILLLSMQYGRFPFLLQLQPCRILQVSSSCLVGFLFMGSYLHVPQALSACVVGFLFICGKSPFMCSRFPLLMRQVSYFYTKVCSSCAVSFFFMCDTFLVMHIRFPLHLRQVTTSKMKKDSDSFTVL